MKVEFLSGHEIDRMHHRGETVFAYEYPYEDMPEDFAERERALFKELERRLSSKFGEDNIYVSYETWADLVIRTYVDLQVLSKDLITTLQDFTKEKAPDHYVSCGVSNFEMEEGGHYGMFAFNHERFLVEDTLKQIWIDEIGDDFEWEPWDVATGAKS